MELNIAIDKVQTRSKPARILLADDNQLVRETLRSFLESRQGLSVVGEAVCGTQAVEMARTLNPDVILLDISMPWLNGIAATEQILAFAPETKIVALSVHNERHYIERMLDAGAWGYVSKDCDLDELEAAVRSVLEDRHYVSSNLGDIQHPRLEKTHQIPTDNRS